MGLKNKYLFLVMLTFLMPTLAKADVSLNALFSDGMVIQRETEIPIWGWADPKEEISITSSWGTHAKTIASEDGTWQAILRTPKAGGPFKIVVKGKNTLNINNVLSGEVWLCTGQSNMDFAMEKFLRDAREPKYQSLVEYIRKEVFTAKEDWIRHIEVPQTTSLHEKKVNFKGEWVSADQEGIKKITATGYFFAKELRNRLNIPIGLVECSWGGSRIEPWISEKAYFEDKNLRDFYSSNRSEVQEIIKKMDAKGYVDTVYVKQLVKWEKNNKKGRKPKPTEHPRRDRQTITALYNGMLHAVIPYKIKGAIWYQGESNAVYRPKEYQNSLTAMIKNWRTDWKQGDFSFYWTQLAACNRANDEADKGWATVNDQLRRTLSVPNTGMAVLYDIGEAKDIHPHNKMDAGKRLALLALKKDYNEEIGVASGPLYHSFKLEGSKIELQFTEVGSGLMVGHKNLLDNTVKIDAPLKWFEIQDNNGDWKPASAKITANNTIKVWNKSVSKPMAVRYAWSGNPEGANLYNKEGLPAAVFSTQQ